MGRENGQKTGPWYILRCIFPSGEGEEVERSRMKGKQGRKRKRQKKEREGGYLS